MALAGWCGFSSPRAGSRRRPSRCRAVDRSRLVVGPHEAIISPLDYLPGYLVPDGRPARPFWCAWQWRNCDPGTAARDSMGASRTLGHVDAAGPDGRHRDRGVRAPAAGRPFAGVLGRPGRCAGQSITPKRVARTTTYGSAASSGSPERWPRSARPGGWSLTAPLAVAARLPSVDPATGAQHALPGPSAELLPAAGPGVIAPDGSAAAIAAASGDRVTLHLLNLVSGSDQQIPVSLDAESAADQRLAWSPDSRWLFVVTAQGKLAAVDARTGHVESLGVSLPPLSLIAVRS